MFLTTHAAAGILISSHLGGPWQVFGLSFASHFILDFIPHGDERLYRDEEWRGRKRYRRVALINAADLAGLAVLSAWAVANTATGGSGLLVIGVLGSILPDLLSHFFPVIHERLSWLALVRWLYSLSKPTGLRFFVRFQNWVHEVLHHDIIHRDIPFKAGLAMQAVLVALMLALSG